MPELPLSYVVLEFFVWNPNWDQYLGRLLAERLEKSRRKSNNNQGK